jgi:hypothetical protein
MQCLKDLLRRTQAPMDNIKLNVDKYKINNINKHKYILK